MGHSRWEKQEMGGAGKVTTSSLQGQGPERTTNGAAEEDYMAFVHMASDKNPKPARGQEDVAKGSHT